MEVGIPIRWRDADALGHVNNAVYLTHLEELLAVVLGPVLGDDHVTARVESSPGIPASAAAGR